METGEPVSYEFPGHAVGTFAHRRPLDASFGPTFPYYPHATTASYSLTYQTPTSSAAYNFGPHPYQPYFVSGPQPLNPQARPPPLPDIQAAKHAINQLPTTSPRTQSTGPSPSRDGHGHLDAATETAKSKGSQGSAVEFSTEVDVLMKAIQSKAGEAPPSSSSSASHSLPPLQHLTPPGTQAYTATYSTAARSRYTPTEEGQLSRSGKKRKYTCLLPGCGKSFAQKTHLDIHTRAHTGEKPFICAEPSCGQRFSQLGNLKTHQRRHTGEKPFACDLCPKRFAQRGNVRAHKATHGNSKQFTCRLDECGKQFTQLGNLKSHQNKFHAATLRNLILRFSQLEEGPVNPQDRDLWAYFTNLYKNSNKGIKGRGKDRRISAPKRADHTSAIEETKIHRDDYEDHLSMYTAGSSSNSDGDDPNPYFMDRGGQ